MPKCERLSDHSTKRDTENVSALEADAFEQSGRVISHLVERVGGVDLQAGKRASELLPSAAATPLLDNATREADVAIIEPNELKAAIEKHRTQALGPMNELGTEPHDQKEGDTIIAENLVLELNTVRFNARHEPMIRCFPRVQVGFEVRGYIPIPQVSETKPVLRENGHGSRRNG